MIRIGKSICDKWVDVAVFLQDHDGLIERWKRKNMENILELHNKSPVWNDGKIGFTAQNRGSPKHQGPGASCSKYR